MIVSPFLLKDKARSFPPQILKQQHETPEIKEKASIPQLNISHACISDKIKHNSKKKPTQYEISRMSLF